MQIRRTLKVLVRIANKFHAIIENPSDEKVRFEK